MLRGESHERGLHADYKYVFYFKIDPNFEKLDAF